MNVVPLARRVGARRDTAFMKDDGRRHRAAQPPQFKVADRADASARRNEWVVMLNASPLDDDSTP
jgi:hypothetical protein